MVKIPAAKKPKKIAPTKKEALVPTYRKRVKGRSGLTVGHVGEQTCGKSIAALQYGYLNLEFESELESAGYGDIVLALKDKYIPEVKTITRINSEWDEEQLDRPVESSLVGMLMEEPRYKEIKIDLPTKDVLLTLEGLADDVENFAFIDTTFNSYMNTIEDVAARKDPNELLIVDSMSLFKGLIDLKNDVIWSLESRGKTDERLKGMRGQKWTRRNQWNRKALLLLRSIKGWTVSTFREIKNSAWTQSQFGSDPTSIQWTEDTGFQYDMMYQFNKDIFDNSLSLAAMPEYCRYIYRGAEAEKYNRFQIEHGSRLGIFPAIQGVLKRMQEDEAKVHW